MGESAIGPLFDPPCAECGMPRPPTFHPYLHCLIWRSLHLDPDTVLAGYGYARKTADALVSNVGSNSRAATG